MPIPTWRPNPPKKMVATAKLAPKDRDMRAMGELPKTDSPTLMQLQSDEGERTAAIHTTPGLIGDPYRWSGGKPSSWLTSSVASDIRPPRAAGARKASCRSDFVSMEVAMCSRPILFNLQDMAPWTTRRSIWSSAPLLFPSHRPE